MAVSEGTIRVLLVAGSPSMHPAVCDGLASDPGFEIAGQARTAAEGRMLAFSAKFDVALVDASLPDGTAAGFLEFLQMARPGKPAVVTAGPAAMHAVASLASATVHVVQRPAAARRTLLGFVERELLPVIARSTAVVPLAAGRNRSPVHLAPASVVIPSLVLIAASTGGPNALEVVLSGLPASFPAPIMVVQHMPASFTPLLAARLDRECPLAVVEAVDGCRLAAGTVYVAPGDRHLSIGGRGTCRVSDEQPVRGCRPSADILLHSAAAHQLAPRTLAVVLTGMGSDGADGAGELVRAGGSVICQDEASSVVWGMPGSVARAGLAYAVLPLNRISLELESRVRASQ